MRLRHIICLTLRPQFPLPPSKHTLIWKVRRESKCKIEILRLTSLRCARRLVSSHLRLSSVAYLPPSCQGGAPKIGSRLTPQSPLINVELCRLHTIMKASKSLGFQPLGFFSQAATFFFCVSGSDSFRFFTAGMWYKDKSGDLDDFTNRFKKSAKYLLHLLRLE